MRPATRILPLLAFAALAVGGCAGSIRPASARTQIPPAAAQHTLAANRAVADADVNRLLTTLRLPPAALRVNREPAGDGYLLSDRGTIEPDRAAAHAHGWWIVHEPSAQVLAYVQSHAPSGGSLTFHGSGGEIGGGALAGLTSTNIGYTWPNIGDQVTGRLLQVTVVRLSGGRTGVLAQAQSDWVIPRSASESVPNGVTAVTVTLQRPPGGVVATTSATRSTVVLNGKAKVARAVALIDSLGVVQPETIMCPMILTRGGSLTVTYSARPGGPVLAQARVSLQHGGSGGSACNPISFTIRGLVQQSLIGTDFSGQMLALAGLHSS